MVSFQHQPRRPVKIRALAAALAALALAACTPTPVTAPPSQAASQTVPPGSASPVPTERTTPGPATASAAPSAGSRPLGWGPEQQDLDTASAAVASMSTEEKAGQVLLPFFQGTDVASHAAVIERLHLAGAIIMGDNVPQSQGQVDTAAMTATNRLLSQATQADGDSWPGLIGVDQEGGIVARLGAPLTEWPTPMSLGAAGSTPLASEAGSGIAAELAPLGYTVDFAPDTDVTIGPQDPTIGSRSISTDPDVVATLGMAFSQGMLKAGVLPVVKHFPGHGSVTTDSHLALPVQPASVDELKARDWKPFAAAAAAGAPMMMTGHIAVPAMEPGVPASLSAPTYAALRGLGFKGVTVTDALNMEAVDQQYPAGAAAVKALAAGADLLLMPADVDQAHAGIVQAVASGALPAQRLAEAARQVVTMMVWRGRTAATPGAAPGAGAALSAKISSAAVTVVAGPCSGPLVPNAVRVSGGGPGDKARFEAAAARAGLAMDPAHWST
ncbi:glycoside hydrolase family 3 N-terminal domain-containing protein [Arthrobacter ulcerisalmonis]